jgi:hypothetical protein
MTALSVLMLDDPHAAHQVPAALHALRDQSIISVHGGQTGNEAAAESNWEACKALPQPHY